MARLVELRNRIMPKAVPYAVPLPPNDASDSVASSPYRLKKDNKEFVKSLTEGELGRLLKENAFARRGVMLHVDTFLDAEVTVNCYTYFEVVLHPHHKAPLIISVERLVDDHEAIVEGQPKVAITEPTPYLYVSRHYKSPTRNQYSWKSTRSTDANFVVLEGNDFVPGTYGVGVLGRGPCNNRKKEVIPFRVQISTGVP